MPDRYAAFVSYAHRYKAWIAVLQRNLERCLEAAGAEPAEVFLDQTDLGSGRSWVAQLQEGLVKSDQLILVAAPEALASPRVEDEWDGFIAARREWSRGGFHVVMLVDVPLPPFVGRIQRLDFVDHDDERYRAELKKLVGGLLGRGPRDLPELPDGVEVPPAPADVLPRGLRRRLVDWIAPLARRKTFRVVIANALGIAPATLEGHTTWEMAASAAIAATTGDDHRVQAARRVVRSLRDAFEEEDDLLAELESLDAELSKLEDDGEGGLLGAWMKCVGRDHSNLVPFFEHADLELLDRVYVQLELRPEARLVRGKDEGTLGLERHLTIRELLALERKKYSWLTHRWVVRGDPGAGKTTLLRHLAATLATERRPRFVPVFESLPRLMREPEFLLVRLERQLLRAGTEVKGLAAALEREAREGRLLLLLDGLDEVPRERREEAETLLRELSGRWPSSPIVVTSRPIGYRRPGSEFVELELLPFDDGQRWEFLTRWFSRDPGKAKAGLAEDVMGILADDAGLRELAENPLYLTLMALLFEGGTPPNRNRASLYDQVFDLLLDGRHRPGGKPIDRKKAVYDVLRRLACDMTQDNRDAEPMAEIEARLYQDEYNALRRSLEKFPAWRRSLGPFLEDLAEKTGILGPHDGPTADWRYWHRTFREALTAEQLAADFKSGGEATVLEKAGEVAGDESRWAEPFALLVGRVEDPDSLVSSLVETNRALGLRAVATAQRLRDETVRGVLKLTEKWEERRDVYLEIPELIDDAERALALIDQLRQLTRDGNDLYFLEETAVAVGQRWPGAAPLVARLRDRFFDHVPVPDEGFIPWVEIPAGEGWIGAADGEEDFDFERPRHRVKILRPFEMGATPMTNAQYAVFDDTHPWKEWKGVSRAELAQHPVVNVTWYAAVAFCRWLSSHFPGVRLPLEEEWEYACRAGTETRYWSGESEADLARAGWYSANSDRRTHRVREKEANPWGLYDMHGNVWEWCEDLWRNDYNAEPKGSGRVYRGGSWYASAQGVRAAYRYHDVPSSRWYRLGFRLARGQAALEPGGGAPGSGGPEPPRARSAPARSAAEAEEGGEGRPDAAEDRGRRPRLRDENRDFCPPGPGPALHPGEGYAPGTTAASVLTPTAESQRCGAPTGWLVEAARRLPER